MDTPITIRPITADEQAAARDLVLAGLAERWGDLDPSRNPDLDDIISTFSGGVFLVALAGGEVIGTGGLLPENFNDCRIVRMSVRKSWRGHGVGSAILNELVQAATVAGYRNIVLETTATWTDAVDFYLHRDFRSLGVRDGDHHFVRTV